MSNYQAQPHYQQPTTFNGHFAVWTWPAEIWLNKSSTGKACACVVMLHDLFDSNYGKQRLFVQMSKLLAERNIASLRYDYLGHGNSQQELSACNLSQLVEQAKAAVRHASQADQVDPLRIMLLGQGFGAMLATLAAADLNLAANERQPLRLLFWAPRLPQGYYRWLINGQLPASLLEEGGWLVSRQLVSDLVTAQPLEALANLANRGNVCHVLTGDQHQAEVTAALAYAQASRADARAFPQIDSDFASVAAADWLLAESLEFFMGY